MVSVDEAVIARIEIGDKRFEILVDPRMAWDLKSGKSVSIQNMLAVSQVFSDAKKGDKAGMEDVRKAFGTDDILEIAERIVKDGEIQLTTEIIRELTEKKRRAVAEEIHRSAVDPRTGVPHPIDRILAAMEEAKVRIDYRQPTEKLVQETIEAIKRVIPLSFEKCKLSVMVSVEAVGKSYGFLKSLKVLKEEWTSSGDLILVIEIPRSMKAEIISKISGLTHGRCSIKEV